MIPEAREGEAPAEPGFSMTLRLGRSLALPFSPKFPAAGRLLCFFHAAT